MIEVLGLVIVLALLAIIFYEYQLSQSEDMMGFFKRSNKKSIYEMYFDNNGTTRPHPEVLKAMMDAALLGNPSSSYSQEAKDIIAQLRSEVYKHTNTSQDTHNVIITSGASESNNLIIRGLVDNYWRRMPQGPVPNIILSTVEHKTSIQCADELQQLGRCTTTYVQVQSDSTTNPKDVEEAIKETTILVSIMHANNETGAMNDIKRIGDITKKRNILFHSDAVQTFGKYPIPMPDWNVDAISMSFHKMNGPSGIGLLILSKAYTIEPQICGTQNDNLRGGTENTPAIAGALKAMQITIGQKGLTREKKNQRLKEMKDQIVKCITDKCNLDKFQPYYGQTDTYIGADRDLSTLPKPLSAVFLGATAQSGYPQPDQELELPNTILVSFVKPFKPDSPTPYQNFCNIKLKKELEKEGVIVSIGSACNTQIKGPSHVLKAINAPFIIRCGVIRISLGDYNTKEDCQKLCKILDAALQKQIDGVDSTTETPKKSWFGKSTTASTKK